MTPSRRRISLAQKRWQDRPSHEIFGQPFGDAHRAVIGVARCGERERSPNGWPYFVRLCEIASRVIDFCHGPLRRRRSSLRPPLG